MPTHILVSVIFEQIYIGYGSFSFILLPVTVFISPYSVAFGVILSLLFLFVCTVEDISTQDGAIGVKFWLRVEQTPGTGTR